MINSGSIFLGKAELDFTHPLSEELILYAAPKIQKNLMQVMEHFYDEETRENDPRRVHMPLERTVFRADYEKDAIKITNNSPDEGGPARQFNYMYYGNLGSPICARGKTQRILKGYSSNDRHKTVARGGKKTLPGDLGVPRPRMLKFWSSRDHMFIYRKCVKPIGRGIIESFQTSIRQAVFQAIESASWDIRHDADIDEDIPFGVSEGGPANDPVGEYSPTMEEIIYSEYGSVRSDQEVQEQENEQTTMDSRIGQKTENELRSFGMMAADIKNIISTRIWKPLRGLFK